MSDSLPHHELQHSRLLCPSLSPEVCSNLCPLSHDTTQPSHPLSPPSPPVLNLSQHQGLFQWIDFTSGGQSIGASASVLPMNIQGWFPLRLTGLISLLSKGLSSISPTQQFESINSSLLSLLYGPTLTSIYEHCKNHSFDYTDLCWQSIVSAF